MEFIFGKRNKEEKNSDLICDLQGNPYKFYRGKKVENISTGIFFCSSFDIAKSYSLEEIVFESEVCVTNPLVIDATTEDGHSYYESIHIRKCKMYPEIKRSELISHLDVVHSKDTLSTDEILQWAMQNKNIDAVIIKNVREGINSELPIYDVMIWDMKNLVNLRNVTELKKDYDLFRMNTFKRVNLSEYISEKEEDGVINTIHFLKYNYVNEICRGQSNKWYMNHKIVIETQAKTIQVKNSDTNEKVTGLIKSPGVYSYAVIFGEENLVPNEDRVIIDGMCSVMKRYDVEEFD